MTVNMAVMHAFGQQVAAREQAQNSQLPVAATAKLRSLISGHVVGPTDFDSHSLRSEACIALLHNLDSLAASC